MDGPPTLGKKAVHVLFGKGSLFGSSLNLDELPFAGLHQLVRPCLGLLERLPDPQEVALRGALGLSFEPVEDRFLVSLGLLSLLAEAGEENPVLCLVDDAHWLDHPSQEALVFAARRVEADSVAILVAARTGDPRRFDGPGLPEVELAGITESDAAALVSERIDHDASPEVLSSLLGAARGNPLALLELPAGLTAAQLDGAEPIVGPPPARGGVEEEFRSRIGSLPEPSRRVLMLAAADEVGELGAIERAAGRLDLSLEDLAPAEAAGLVRVDEEITFRHPLVRSAAYRSSPREQRKAAHETLASVIDDPVRSV